MDAIISQSEARKLYHQNGGKVVDDSVDGFVVLKNINKVYDNHVQAVYNFNLSIRQKEFIVLVGPSGCGKSTTLRMIAGLEEISGGYLYIAGVMANHLESKDRDIAMVFQSYALYPNMTVYDNIGFGLSVRGVPKAEIRKKVFEAADILDLGPYLDRRPKELSGGQMQRVALGRAIVRDAKLFLMDEPLSNLDAKLRVQMRSEIVKLHRRISATTVYVTHDQTEAMTMADRIVVMNKGFVQQIGTPAEIYNEPANVFVATFIGNPPMNVFRAKAENGKLTSGGNTVSLPQGFMEKYSAFIEERERYFDALQECCNLEPEQEIEKQIQAFLPKMRTCGAERLKEICVNLAALAERKRLLTFTQENEEELMQAFENGNFRLVKRELKKYIIRLKETDFEISAILGQTGSAEAFVKKEEIVAPKEKKRKKKNVERDIHSENLEKISTYLAAYRAAKGENADLFVGIRPENIHLYEEFHGNASEPITVVADFVELLGSEYCVYFDLFGSRLIFKLNSNRLIRMGDTIQICFDMDKMKFFDCVSGATIM